MAMRESLRQPDSGDCPEMIQVEVAYSPGPREVLLERILLRADACTVRHALDACSLEEVKAWLQKGTQALHLGVAGVAVHPDVVLFDGERLDCCRPLRVDPKLARRERFNQQGVRRSGLFAKRRPGAVAGY